MSKKKLKPVYIWTWVADFGDGPTLCLFAEATKKQLLHQGRPTPGAKPIRVRMCL